jgi:mono/diheme cytochrome c family protein
MKTIILLSCATLLPVLFLFATSSSQPAGGKSDTPRPTDVARGDQRPTSVARGEKLFQRNCASCHGLDGRGAGLVAASLKKQPSDLTMIPRKNGKFPTEELVMSISGELSLPIHGSREMPVWGGVLKNGDILSLVRYIESIQRTLPIPTK